MRLEVAYATERQQTLIAIELDEGATVAQALRAVAEQPPFAALPLDSMPVGIFGRLASRETALKEGDRLELYRPLAIDPREARHQRAEAGNRSPESAAARRHAQTRSGRRAVAGSRSPE